MELMQLEMFVAVVEERSLLGSKGATEDSGLVDYPVKRSSC